MSVAYDIGALQTTPGQAIGPLRPNPGIPVQSIAIGAQAGFSASVAIEIQESLTIGGKAGFTASLTANAALSIAIGGKAGITAAQGTSAKSIAIGAEAGITCSVHLQSAESIAIGGEAGIAASSLNTSPESIAIGGEAGFTASLTANTALSIAIGGEAGFSATVSGTSTNGITLGGEAGIAASSFNTSPLTLTIGAEAGITTAVAERSTAGVALGAEAGFTASAFNSANNTQCTFGGIAGFIASCKLILGNSITIGVEAGITAHFAFPQTLTLGAKGGFSASIAMDGYQALTFGTKAGFSAFGSTSVLNQQNTIAVVITSGGSGYSAGSGLTAVISGTSGTPVTGTVQLGAPGTAQAGQVVGIVPQTNAGNLTGPLTVTITGGGGTGATAVATLSSPLSGGLGGSSSTTGSTTTAATGQTGQQQPLQVRAEGYGILTIETLTLLQAQTPGILPPPIRQPTAQQVPAGSASSTGDTSSVASRPWNTWYQSVYAAIQPSVSTVQFLAPSIDETDSEWYGVGSLDGSTDPATFTASFTGQSRFGMVGAVIQGGTGYTDATVLTVSGAGGSGYGAELTPIIEMGAIVGIATTQSGYGYVSPLSLVATDTGGGSGAILVVELGRQFAVGDYILWNDPTVVAGVCGYEIDQITTIVPIDETSATFTVSRNPGGGAPADQAQYGSPFDAHSNVAFYRLINKLFVASANPDPGPQVLKFAWDNMTVAAVQALIPGAPPYTINLAPMPYVVGTTNLNPLTNPTCPGLRTMNGAAYTNLGISGALTVGLTSSARVSVQAHESIRTVYAKVLMAPTGPTTFNGDANACIVIYVCYISPAGVVGLIDTLVIDATMFNSYSTTNPPDGRQMPFHVFWSFDAPNADWPPNRLPVCAGALSAGGLLQLPITPDGSSTVLFTPDGAIDFIVAQVGTSTAGSNLVVTVQT